MSKMRERTLLKAGLSMDRALHPLHSIHSNGVRWSVLFDSIKWNGMNSVTPYTL